MLDAEFERQKRLLDAECKNILSERQILAFILKECLAEFKDFDRQVIANELIEGTPEVSTIAVEPPERTAGRIEGLNTEDGSVTEGEVFYDIRFTAYYPTAQRPVQMIINIEAQNDFHPGYPLLYRAQYYCARMVSSQYGTNGFVQSHYERLRPVVSIWIFTSPTRAWAGTINRYRLGEEMLVGDAAASPADYDLMKIVSICLGDKGGDRRSLLIEMLDKLLIRQSNSADIVKSLAEDYDVRVTPALEGRISDMCNISDGLVARSMAEGEARGEARGEVNGANNLILTMLRKHKSIRDIADFTDWSLEKIRELARVNNLAIVE